MPMPNTGGQLRTRIQDMKVGDYIQMTYSSTTGNWVLNGGTQEIPVTSQANIANGNYLYAIKVDKGLLVADRCSRHSLSWDYLNGSVGVIQGSPLTLGGVSGIIRSLGGGNAYADIKSIIPVMTSNTAPSGIASASSEHTSQGFYAWRVFDGVDNNLAWLASYRVFTGWLSYQFSQPKVVRAYSLKCRNDSANNGAAQAPKDWTFEGWNGTQWVVLDSRTGVTSWNYGVRKSFYINNNKEYLQYRINVTAHNGHPDFLGIGEFEMYDQQAIDNATMSLTDKGFGAFPSDNEWDEYIVRKDYGTGAGRDDVWHWSNVGTWVQETPVIGLATSDKRVMRGGPYTEGVARFFYGLLSSASNPNYGFRPVFEYQEV